MSTRQIHVFISHSWAYSNHYDTLQKWIFGEPWSAGSASLDFRDYSVPKNDPIHHAPTDKQLRDAIYGKLGRSHVVVIPTGMYTNYSKWIGKEIDGANQYNKPILAVNPWGQLRTSSVVAKVAKKVVGWNKEPLVDAIWQLYKEANA
jgi:hypothetical protein